MKTHHFLILAFVFISHFGDARAAQKITPGFDVEDLNSATKSEGAITPNAFNMIMIALEELKKYQVAFEKYKSIHAWQTNRYYYVTFSPNELGSTMHGRLPSEQMIIEVQIAKATMRITGSRTE